MEQVAEANAIIAKLPREYHPLIDVHRRWHELHPVRLALFSALAGAAIAAIVTTIVAIIV